MPGIDRSTLLNNYQREMDSDTVALFIGAGLSRPAGFVDWRGLMREIAEEVGLDVDKETDLIAIAQYHKTSRKSRHKLNQTLVTEFTKSATLTENHHLLASLPVSTVWTTNYDHLLEQAYAAAHKRVDIKRRPEDLALTRPHTAVTIYKMHGDVDAPDEAVLTKDDYAAFESKRTLFSTQFGGHLVAKSFLFLGYSFSDPNIDYILHRIRAHLGHSAREHYCVMRDVDPTLKRADKEYRRRQLQLRVDDLQTYGIQTLLVREYSEVTGLLAELNRRAVRKNVFVSGSADDFGPLGQPALESFARALGREIIDHEYNLISGLGLGIGGAVTIGALEALYSSPSSQLDERAVLRPFPQVPPSRGDLKAIWERYRQEMIAKAGFAVFIAGNKMDKTSGKVVDANGVRREFEIARDRKVYPIPVGGTGWVAADLSREVLSNLKVYYGPLARKVEPALKTLAGGNSEKEWCNAILEVIRAAAPK